MLQKEFIKENKNKHLKEANVERKDRERSRISAT